MLLFFFTCVAGAHLPRRWQHPVVRWPVRWWGRQDSWGIDRHRASRCGGCFPHVRRTRPIPRCLPRRLRQQRSHSRYRHRPPPLGLVIPFSLLLFLNLSVSFSLSLSILPEILILCNYWQTQNFSLFISIWEQEWWLSNRKAILCEVLVGVRVCMCKESNTAINLWSYHHERFLSACGERDTCGEDAHSEEWSNLANQLRHLWLTETLLLCSFRSCWPCVSSTFWLSLYCGDYTRAPCHGRLPWLCRVACIFKPMHLQKDSAAALASHNSDRYVAARRQRR